MTVKKGFGIAVLTMALLGARAWRPAETGVSAQASVMDPANDDRRSPPPPAQQEAATGAGGGEIDLLDRDPAIGRNWGLEGTDSLRAWRITRGDKKTIVAVIDTGIDISHPDLRENIWVNAGETGPDPYGGDKATNGLDDDRNGYVDDVHGWNFAAGSNDVRDRHGHGTHIAGIIGAVGGNGVGLSGVSPQVSLMALKYCEPGGLGGDPVANTAAAIRYAIRMGAHVINYSAGGPLPDDEELTAIREADDAGILLVAAAGNERSNSDLKPYYPADYELPNILSVTAFDQRLAILPTSNYGIRTVDLAAPGKDIFSTLPGGRYGRLSGTSQATAFATGVAALVMAKHGLRRDPARVAAALTLTGDTDPSLAGKTKFRARLNTYRALAIEGLGVSATGAPATGAAYAQIDELRELARGLEILERHESRGFEARGPAGTAARSSPR